MSPGVTAAIVARAGREISANGAAIRAIVVNGNVVDAGEVHAKLKSLLAGREREEDRVVVVKSAPDTPYDQWIRVSQAIDEAGGILTLELKSERTVTVD